MKLNTLLLLSIAAIAACSSPIQNRNVALHRAATASSATDYNLTAQLATDGIIEEDAPSSMRFYLNGEPLPREEADWLLDEKDKSKFTLDVNSFTLELVCRGCSVVTDGVCYYATFKCKNTISYAPYSYVLLATEDGKEWKEYGRWEGLLTEREIAGGGGTINLEAALPRGEYRGFKLLASCQTAMSFTFNELYFFLDGKQIQVRPSSVFSSYWVSGKGEDEWLCVDLGAESELDSVRMFWHNPPLSGRILLSNDAKRWKKAAELENSDFTTLRGKARYVKLELDRTADLEPFSLSEIQVYGRNGLSPRESDWSLVRADRKDDPQAWMPATVPGTVLTSYLDNGAVPDPFYGNDNTQISESYFLTDFIYRGKMNWEGGTDGGRVWLNFDGINWKADVSLNSVLLGHIAGAFTSAVFDVTDIVRQGENEVEVYVHCPDNPGPNKADTYRRCARNGGKLGADNPTFHATVGWDWMPSVHGRDIGIWNDVYFSSTGQLRLEDPVLRTELNADGSADVLLGTVLRNCSSETVNASWHAAIGEYEVEETVSIPPMSSVEKCRTVRMDSPRLWWPNGYGSQELYRVKMTAATEGTVSDSLAFNAGLRQVTYDTSDGRLSIYVNGRRLVGRGGNWGFSEALLRYRAEQYDYAVGLEAAENFNIIRNWVGQTGDEEFYEACDRYGVMVWQDFWLANPTDGPDPDDEEMFMQNADNYLRRIRNHPCIALYCGRNEGTPPPGLDKGLRELVGRLAPDMIYFPDSSRGWVSGHGPYHRRTALQTFTSWGQGKFHSELGMPNVPEYESLVRFIPEDHLWPQDDIWGYHNYTLESAQSVGTYNAAVEKMFGKPEDARQFCEWAQWVNYDGYRAIFESRSAQRRGLTLWMSHSSWPDMVFCTYDYYFDTDAAYYGCRKACEPIHIQWNPSTRKVEVVNVSAGDRSSLVARAYVLDMYGRELSVAETGLDSAEDSTVECFPLGIPAAQDVYYYRLELRSGEDLMSENFYVLGRETDNFQALHKLPQARVKAEFRDGVLTLTNVSEVPAMMLRIKALDTGTGEMLLPARISDNYFHLMPGESRKLSVSSWNGDIAVRPEIRGFNVELTYPR